MNPTQFMPFSMGMMMGMKPERKPRALPPTKHQRTLYVRNLNEKIKLETLKQSLEAIFSQFGQIQHIRLKHNIKQRGQAFVTFENIEIATEAMLRSQNFPLFDKPMDIQYSREPTYLAEEGHQNEGPKRKQIDRVEKKPKKKTTAEDNLPPNSILFCQNLPATTTEQVLITMFSQFPGFKEVRTVPGRADIGIILLISLC
jgi:U2 small nuclear ribonucleoprotein B''